ARLVRQRIVELIKVFRILVITIVGPYLQPLYDLQLRISISKDTIELIRLVYLRRRRHRVVDIPQLVVGLRASPAAIRIYHRYAGIEPQRAPDQTRLGGFSIGSRTIRVRIHDVLTHLQPVEYLMLGIDPEAVPLEVRVDDHTLLIEIVTRETIS